MPCTTYMCNVYVCRLVAGKQNHAEKVAGFLRAIECDET